CRPPPVEMFMTASVCCLMRGRKSMNRRGSGDGSPVSGLRACRWMIDAPASAAPTAASTIWLGVNGRYGLIVGVWIDPVTAQVMMTLDEDNMFFPSQIAGLPALGVDVAVTDGGWRPGKA